MLEDNEVKENEMEIDDDGVKDSCSSTRYSGTVLTAGAVGEVQNELDCEGAIEGTANVM